MSAQLAQIRFGWSQLDAIELGRTQLNPAGFYWTHLTYLDPVEGWSWWKSGIGFMRESWWESSGKMCWSPHWGIIVTGSTITFWNVCRFPNINCFQLTCVIVLLKYRQVKFNWLILFEQGWWQLEQVYYSLTYLKLFGLSGPSWFDGLGWLDMSGHS